MFLQYILRSVRLAHKTHSELISTKSPSAKKMNVNKSRIIDVTNAPLKINKRIRNSSKEFPVVTGGTAVLGVYSLCVGFRLLQYLPLICDPWTHSYLGSHQTNPSTAGDWPHRNPYPMNRTLIWNCQNTKTEYLLRRPITSVPIWLMIAYFYCFMTFMVWYLTFILFTWNLHRKLETDFYLLFLGSHLMIQILTVS